MLTIPTKFSFPFPSCYDSIYFFLVVPFYSFSRKGQPDLDSFGFYTYSIPPTKRRTTYCTLSIPSQSIEMNYTNLTVSQASPSSLEYCFSKWSNTTLQICFASFPSDFAFSYDDKKKLLTHSDIITNLLNVNISKVFFFFFSRQEHFFWIITSSWNGSNTLHVPKLYYITYLWKSKVFPNNYFPNVKQRLKRNLLGLSKLSKGTKLILKSHCKGWVGGSPL